MILIAAAVFFSIYFSSSSRGYHQGGLCEPTEERASGRAREKQTNAIATFVQASKQLHVYECRNESDRIVITKQHFALFLDERTSERMNLIILFFIPIWIVYRTHMLALLLPILRSFVASFSKCSSE